MVIFLGDILKLIGIAQHGMELLEKTIMLEDKEKEMNLFLV